MNCFELRRYIINNLSAFENITFQSTDIKTNSTYTSIYLIEKPQNHKLTSGNGLVIKFSELNGGNVVRHFEVSIHVLSKNLKNATAITQTLIDMLDFYNRPCAIKEYIKFRFSHDSGIFYDDNLQMYVNALTFDCKKI